MPDYTPRADKAEWHLTYHCDLACTCCNRACFLPPATPDMTLDDARDFCRQAEELYEVTGWRPRIMIIGGEPTLHRDFLEFVAIALAFAGPGRVEVWSNGRTPVPSSAWTRSANAAWRSSRRAPSSPAACAIRFRTSFWPPPISAASGAPAAPTAALPIPTAASRWTPAATRSAAWAGPSTVCWAWACGPSGWPTCLTPNSPPPRQPACAAGAGSTPALTAPRPPAVGRCKAPGSRPHGPPRRPGCRQLATFVGPNSCWTNRESVVGFRQPRQALAAISRGPLPRQRPGGPKRPCGTLGNGGSPPRQVASRHLEDFPRFVQEHLVDGPGRSLSARTLPATKESVCPPPPRNFWRSVPSSSSRPAKSWSATRRPACCRPTTRRITTASCRT